MHESSYKLMEALVGGLRSQHHFGEEDTVLDCGSAIAGTGIQKSYRDFFKEKYVGFDASKGKNVDVVGDIYDLPRLDPAPKLIISGQMLEHLMMPILAVQRMKVVLADEGWMILIAPWQYGIHRYPVDCWRVLPDGMRFLFEGFEAVETGTQGCDCWGIGRKPPDYKSPWNISRS